MTQMPSRSELETEIAENVKRMRLAKHLCPECGTRLKLGYHPNNNDPGDVDPTADCPGCGWGY